MICSTRPAIWSEAASDVPGTVTTLTVRLPSLKLQERASSEDDASDRGCQRGSGRTVTRRP